MASTSIDEDLVEEREELMVFPSENNSRPVIKKAHFLKPCVSSSIEETSEGMLRPVPSPEIKASTLCVSFRGWRLPNKNFKFWAKKMAALHKPTWLKSGIYEAIKASTYKINKNPSLILSLAQNWCPETNTFVFPWGEATITLEDVNVLLGFSVLGSSVFAPLESSEMKEAVEKLKRRKEEIRMRQSSWISSFLDNEMEHEAFLVLWLSYFVFPDKSSHSILSDVFPIAVRLARGEIIALAPAVLAKLYKDLSKICALGSEKNVYLDSLFKLVQVWIWERFKSIRPEAKEIARNEPRISQWSGLKQRFDNVGHILFDGNFDWRPYIEPLACWNPPRFYLEDDGKWVRIDESLDDYDEFVSFARCVGASKIVGIGLVEDYYPNRVAMQFGLAQDLPGGVTNHSIEFTEQEAWDDYNRSLVGLKLYIPSRMAKASVTARYRDWWAKSVSETRKESTQTFNVSSTVDHYDDSDDEIPLKVMPLSQIFKKLDDRMKKDKPLTNQRRKRSREDDESAAETQDDDDDNDDYDDRTKKDNPLTNQRRKRAREDDESAETQDDDDYDDDDDESDDNLTIAEMIRSRKKCGDDMKNTRGERSRLEVDNHVSGLLTQKLTFGNETLATEETEQKNDENKDSSNPSNGVTEKKEDDYNITIAERIKSIKKCVDVENTGGKGSRLEVVDNNNVSGHLPPKLTFGNETLATKEADQKKDANKTSSNPCNGVAEKKKDDITDDERLKQRKLAVEELALKMEARMLKVENTLAKMIQWKLKRIHTKTPLPT